MRQPLCLAVMLLLCTSLLAQSSQPSSASAQTKTPSPASNGSALSKGFVLEDGTPVKLRINRNVSSSDAHVGETVDFEVLEEVLLIEERDLRRERLVDRKQELRRLLSRVPESSPLKYADHVDGSGTALFERVCKLDLEGIVAKHKAAPYVSSREETTWIKILNPNYSQREDREKLFERDRHKEPVAGWHSCVIACAEVEAN